MKLKQLTTKQEQLMFKIKDKWINQLYDLKPINTCQLLEGIKWLYTFCKMKVPKVIICESPLEAQLTIHFLKNVWNNVVDNVGDNVRNNVGDNEINIQKMCSYGDINDYAWVAFHDFFTEIGINNSPNFNSFMKLLQSNYYSMIQMEKICVVIKLPKHILLNESKQLNSTKDYAIKWNDDTGMYFVNGFYLSNKLFIKLSTQKYSFEEFIQEKNEETKSACIAFMQQEFGDEYLFRFLSKNLKEIDTYVDKKEKQYLQGTTYGMNIGVYTLFKGNIHNIEIAYVRCYCPSTDRMFFLGVNPINTTAKDAIASLCVLPKKLIPYLESIQRQGEIFSSNYTEKGLNILKSLSKEDIADVKSLSGEIYFSKIQYEY